MHVLSSRLRWLASLEYSSSDTASKHLKVNISCLETVYGLTIRAYYIEQATAAGV